MSTEPAAAPLLRALFDVPGTIEMRCVSDRRSGPRGGAASFWFDDVPAATRAIPEVRSFAEARGLTVSLGLLPRRGRSGRAADTLPGRAAWADVDFKGVEEKEARRRIAALGERRPCVTVHSGHGLHLYWLFDEKLEPAVVTSLCRRLGRPLGADACHDASRVLRMPGSLNLKECWSNGVYAFNADRARPCRVECADWTKRFRAEDFVDLPEPPLSVTARAKLNRVNRTISDLPEDVQALIAGDARLAALWHSTGKSGGDVSNSGYDASFALALARKGVADPDVLDAAVAARPSVGATSARCPRAIRRTVDWALAKFRSETRIVEAPPNDWFMDFVAEVEAGKYRRDDLARVLRAAARFVQTPQRRRMAMMLGGYEHQGFIRGVPCPKCQAHAVEWCIPPSTMQARCGSCRSRWPLARLCDAVGIDVLATLSPLMADD